MENFTHSIIPRLKPEEIATLKPKHINTLLAAHKCKGNISQLLSLFRLYG